MDNKNTPEPKDAQAATPPPPQDEAAAPAPAAQGSAPIQPAAPASQTAPAPVNMPKKANSTKGIVIAVVAAIVLLGVGGAAALVAGGVFAGPEERVSRAMQELLKDDEGRFEIELTNDDAEVTIGGGYNLEEAQFDLNLSTETDGIELGAEARIVDGKAYAKIDDLGPLGALLGEDRVDDVWYELTDDVIDDADLSDDQEISCVTDALRAYGKEDRDALAKSYKDNPIFNVEEDGSEDGYDKYLLTPNQENGDSFAEQVLNTVPVFKALEDCDSETINQEIIEDTATETAGDDPEVYVLLDGVKPKRLALESTDDNDVKIVINLDLNENVTVEAPEDAKPISDLLESEFAEGFISGFLGAPATTESSFGGGGFNTAQDQAKDAERRSDINAIYASLEVFYNDNGYYPSDIVSGSTFPGLAPDALVDPDGDELQIYASEFSFSDVFSNFETDYTYAPYECDFAARQCAKYELRTELSFSSDEFSYTRESLN